MTGGTVFGPNDFHMEGGHLEPGLGDAEEAVIRSRRGLTGALEEPPDKAELRRRGEELKAKAKQLSTVERELEKAREEDAAAAVARQEALDAREAELAAREAELEAEGKAKKHKHK